MPQNNIKYSSINIFENIVCTVLVRVDKMGFHRRYDFISLGIDSSDICTDWGLAVEWSEIFNAFLKNALIQKSDYYIGSDIKFNFSAEDGPPTLTMSFKNADSQTSNYSFSKLNCLQIYSKMSKILGKCDLVSLSGY
jgi:hypothetical protein